MSPDDLEDIPVERRSVDRRTSDVPVIHDRRRGDRRAQRLAPEARFHGVAVVVDSWPLVRAGVTQLLQGLQLRVAADCAEPDEARRAVGDRLDLAVIGAIADPLPEVVERLRRLPGPAEGTPPRILVLLERVEVDLLRRLLDGGVDGVVQRSVSLDDLRAACERVVSGHRVLSGGPLSVLATAGLDVAVGAREVDGGPLTRKELEVLSQLARNRSNRQIADALHVSNATVKTHLSNIYAKLEVAGRGEAVATAVELGLLG